MMHAQLFTLYLFFFFFLINVRLGSSGINSREVDDCFLNNNNQIKQNLIGILTPKNTYLMAFGNLVGPLIMPSSRI